MNATPSVLFLFTSMIFLKITCCLLLLPWVFTAVFGPLSRCKVGLLTAAAPLLRSTGSKHPGLVVAAQGLSSCGLWTQLPRGVWDLSGPGIKPASPALVAGFLSTSPPGKSVTGILIGIH